MQTHNIFQQMQDKKIFTIGQFNNLSEFFSTNQSLPMSTGNSVINKFATPVARFVDLPKIANNPLPNANQPSTPVTRLMGIGDNRNYLKSNRLKYFFHREKITHKPARQKHRPAEVKRACFSLIKRPLIIKGSNLGRIRPDDIENIYDWMMEFASLLKLTKNSYYRAILMINKMVEVDCKMVYSKQLNSYICGALSVSAKFESSRINYIEAISMVNQRRVCKSDIIFAEDDILKFLKFKMPVVQIEQTLSKIIQDWNKFIEHESSNKKLLIACGSTRSDICYLSIVYIIDYIVIKMHKQLLKEGDFKLPVLIAMYIQLSIEFGDAQLNQSYVWPSFSKFLKKNQLLKQHKIAQFKNQTREYFGKLKISQAIIGIPLNPKFQQSIEKHEQTYIRRIEINS